MFFLSEDGCTTADLFSSLCIIIFQLAFNYFEFPEATCSKWKQSQFRWLGALSNKALPAALIQLFFYVFNSQSMLAMTVPRYPRTFLNI